jgi:hypothetical protein
MRAIIDYEDIPFKELYSTAEPNKQAFKELKNKGIFDIVKKTCKTEEDLEKAVSGAFIGWHIVNHLIYGEHDPEIVEIMLIEMLGTYDVYDKEVGKSPCWILIKKTLENFGFEDFYQKGIDYIIANRGQLDYFPETD